MVHIASYPRMIPEDKNLSEIRDLPYALYHGTRADLKPEDLIKSHFKSNYGTRMKANHVYLTAALDAANWGAELVLGEGPGRIYLVERPAPFHPSAS